MWVVGKLESENRVFQSAGSAITWGMDSGNSEQLYLGLGLSASQLY
jgi:hypothetical protein